MIETKQAFQKGINDRFSIESGDGSRLHQLQNARLQKRGNTLEVSRIDGLSQISGTSETYTTVFDSLFYDDFLIVYWYDDGPEQAKITITDISDGSEETFVVADDPVGGAPDYGELLLLEDTLFVTPFQKLLTNVSGTWYIKDFISTTPLVSINEEDLGTKATGSITITGDASSEIPATNANTVGDSCTITGAAVDPGNITVSYGVDDVVIAIDGTETIDEVGDEIRAGVNADGDINVTCGYNSSTDGLQFDAKIDGSGENGKNVTINAGSTGVTFSDLTLTMSGGTDEVSGTEGELSYSINGTTELSYDVQYDDTKLIVANGLNTYLNSNSSLYESTVDDSGSNPVINISALTIGTTPNGTITESTNDTIVTYTKTGMSGGASESGTLKQDEDYWYKVRYVYFDGHRTKTSFPSHVNTGLNQGIVIDIATTQDDLDGGWVDVEIFRRKETEDYFLIDRITPTSNPETYTDNGKPKLAPLTEENYIWAETNKTQEIVRDRLVKANNTYANVENNTDFELQGSAQSVESGEQGIPYNTEVELFSQVRKVDGTTTAHKFHQTKSTGTVDGVIQIKQTGEYSPSEDFKEVATYARFRPKESEDVIPFNSLEIYNSNIPSIATEGESEADQDKPTNPHVFLGWKYLEFWYGLVGGASEYNTIQLRDEDWFEIDRADVNDDNTVRFGGESVVSGVSPYDEVISQPITNPDNSKTLGETQKYIKRYEALEPEGSERNSVIYQLSYLEALKEAIRQGKAKLKLTGTNDIQGGLSSERPDDDFIDREINIVGIKDLSITTSPQADEGNEGGLGVDHYLQGPTQHRIYLILESGTAFDDFDNISGNNKSVKGSSQSDIDFTHRYEFEILGLNEVDKETSTTSTEETTGSLNFEYDVIDYDYRLRLTDYTDFENEAGVLVYNRDSQSSVESFFTPDIQGWEKTLNNKFEFYSLNEWNEYSTITTLEDLEQFQRDYPNQLIWSDSYILESNASKVRNFPYTNFKNISGEFGDIVNIQYILGKLVVFCERGVAIVHVGEVLTQQVSGETFVDSSRLLNNEFWILKSVPDIKAQSIVQYENTIYFCDGKDVWRYSDQLENITNGAITLDMDETFVGGIDPKNKEYLLTNEDETFAYSIELGEWQGPYTYAIKTASAYRDNYYGVVGENVVEFNTGNDFDGTSYETIIESVANDLNEPYITKLFRKFYTKVTSLSSSGYSSAYSSGYTSPIKFLYSKDGITYNEIDLSEKPIINNIINVGVAGNYNISTQIYWKIITKNENFVLKSLSFLWNLRKRR